MNCFCKSFITYFPFHIKSVVVVIFKRITEIKLTELPRRAQTILRIYSIFMYKKANKRASNLWIKTPFIYIPCSAGSWAPCSPLKECIGNSGEFIRVSVSVIGAVSDNRKNTLYDISGAVNPYLALSSEHQKHLVFNTNSFQIS